LLLSELEIQAFRSNFDFAFHRPGNIPRRQGKNADPSPAGATADEIAARDLKNVLQGSGAEFLPFPLLKIRQSGTASGESR